MTLYCTNLFKGQKAIIETPEGILEMIVMEIGGSKSKRNIKVDLKGIVDINNLEIDISQGFVEITPNIFLAIKDRPSTSKKVYINFSFSDMGKYRVMKKDYSEAPNIH